MKIILFCFLFFYFLSSSVYCQTERELVLDLDTKNVIAAFRDKKNDSEKTKAIASFVKSMKPLCKLIAQVKWNEISDSELKKIDKELGVFIGGISDYQIKFRSDENAKLTQGDRSEIKKVCKEIEKKSSN